MADLTATLLPSIYFSNARTTKAEREAHNRRRQATTTELSREPRVEICGTICSNPGLPLVTAVHHSLLAHKLCESSLPFAPNTAPLSVNQLAGTASAVPQTGKRGIPAHAILRTSGG